MTIKSPSHIIAAAVLVLVAAPRVSGAAVITVVADPADANTQDHFDDGNLDGTADVPQKDKTGPALWVGRQPNGPGGDQVRAAVFPFELPAAPADSTLIGATLRWNLIQADSPSWAVDLYGLTRTSSNPGSLAADHFVGGSDPSNALIQTGFLAAGAGSGPVATSVPQLKQFVQQKYDDGATGEFVFFRLNPNQESTSLSNDRFTVNSADVGNVPSRPELMLSFAPEGTDVFTLVDGFDGYEGTDDAWIDRDDTGNRNHGGEDAIRVYNRSGRDSLGLLRFDLSPLAQEASKVTSAKLILTTKLRQNDGTAEGELIDLHMIAPADSDWVEGDGTGQVPGDSGTLGASSTFNEKQHGVEDWSEKAPG